ncbi:MAG: hypothetical protein AAF989_00125 [Planctomycetota bacterium]
MRSTFVTLCLLIPIAGCGSSEQAQIKRDLFSISMLYHAFAADTGAAPDDAESLLGYADPNGGLPGNRANSEATKRALRSGDYTVYWGYDVAADKDRNGKTILAFHRNTPENGGLAAFADGLVQSLTADEFSSSAKASEFSSQRSRQP